VEAIIAPKARVIVMEAGCEEAEIEAFQRDVLRAANRPRCTDGGPHGPTTCATARQDQMTAGDWRFVAVRTTVAGSDANVPPDQCAPGQRVVNGCPEVVGHFSIGFPGGRTASGLLS